MVRTKVDEQKRTEKIIVSITKENKDNLKKNLEKKGYFNITQFIDECIKKLDRECKKSIGRGL